MSGRRSTSLDEINRDNVSQMQLHWVFHSRNSSLAGAAPIVADGVIYVATSSDAYAIDGRTGSMLWRHSRQGGASGSDSVAPHTNRSVAKLGNKLYIATDDAHLLCLDARSGNQVWEVSYADEKRNYGPPSAPLVIDEKVVIAVSGKQQEESGLIAAFDATDGKEAWRFQADSIQGSSCGSAVWMPGTFDPNQNEIYWGVGLSVNANRSSAPSAESQHAGCVLALDASTGKLKWKSELRPHESCADGAPQVPVIVDITYKGSSRKVIITAAGNASVYMIDRETGKLLSEPAKPCHGEPERAPGWDAPAYSQPIHLLYFRSGDDSKAQSATQSGTMIAAYDAEYESFAWKEFAAGVKDVSTGFLTTSTGLLLFGDESQSFNAIDAANGKSLWSFHMGESAASPPISYAIEGKQYFLVAAGKDLFAFALP